MSTAQTKCALSPHNRPQARCPAAGLKPVCPAASLKNHLVAGCKFDVNVDFSLLRKASAQVPVRRCKHREGRLDLTRSSTVAALPHTRGPWLKNVLVRAAVPHKANGRAAAERLSATHVANGSKVGECFR